MAEYELQPHPGAPCPAIRRITVRIDRMEAERLVLYYQIEGDVDALELPAQQRSARADELWKQTCFEAFLRPRGAQRYFEFNFSPSSEWAAYAFDEYRQGMRSADLAHAPKIICRRRDSELDADVDLHLAGLGFDYRGEIDIAFAAVLKPISGPVSYWALVHPGERPDFHHPDAFIASAPAPESAA